MKKFKQIDFRQTIDKQIFGVRASALIKQDDKFLFIKDNDTYFVVGGAIQVNELSQEAVRREVKEELGIEITVDKLAFMVENIFVHEDYNYHNIEFHYFCETTQNVPMQMIEQDNKLDVVWLSIHELQRYDIKPNFLKEELPKWCALKHIKNKGV